ncbi:MAG: hypothetical protein K2X63_00405 [Burkholderiaceae bacterium]|nr:hypothetical protein [Burkholderiaceae bacterium]
MNSSIKPGQTAFDSVADAYLNELMDMPDADVLDGLKPGVAKVRGLAMLEVAKKAAGKMRLQAAREAMRANAANSSRPSEAISVADARKFLQVAANDARFTIAARELSELTDQDLLNLYWQVKGLQDDVGE